jgi:hypothetical protein
MLPGARYARWILLGILVIVVVGLVLTSMSYGL